jgi:hypothetical protein
MAKQTRPIYAHPLFVPGLLLVGLTAGFVLAHVRIRRLTPEEQESGPDFETEPERLTFADAVEVQPSSAPRVSPLSSQNSQAAPQAPVWGQAPPSVERDPDVVAAQKKIAEARAAVSTARTPRDWSQARSRLALAKADLVMQQNAAQFRIEHARVNH